MRKLALSLALTTSLFSLSALAGDKQHPRARILHESSAAAADLRAVARSAPSDRLDVRKTTPSPLSSPRTAPQHDLDALATNVHGVFGLVSGRNAVSFNDSQYDKNYIGMGFVIDHQGRYYGITAKHVLLVVNHPQIKHVDPRAELKSWTMVAHGEQPQMLQFGELLNADSGEALDMEVLKTDALVFELNDPGPFTPIKLSDSAPKAGDQLHALGCTFATSDDCTQDVYSGLFVESAEHNLLVDMGDTELNSLRGLSGGPVLNERGELVGIVSNIMPDANGTERFAPANLDYLRSLLPKS